MTNTRPCFSAADSFRVTIYGRGGHGSMPHKCIDPVVIASHIVIRLQTIVSREVPPDETVVITIGSIQSGNTVNVISDEAVMQVNVRTVSPNWRNMVLESMKRIIDAECQADRCPRSANFEKLNAYPLTNNAGEHTQRVQKSFDDFFDQFRSPVDKALWASEDFSCLATSVQKPYVYWAFGGIAEDEWIEARGERYIG